MVDIENAEPELFYVLQTRPTTATAPAWWPRAGDDVAWVSVDPDGLHWSIGVDESYAIDGAQVEEFRDFWITDQAEVDDTVDWEFQLVEVDDPGEEE